MGAAIAQTNQYICTGLIEPFLCSTAISTKIKCAGSFALFLALNPAKQRIIL